MPQRNIAEQLRKQVDRAKGPAAGTVIRFDSVVAGSGSREERRYTYAAVFANSHWYLTGTQCYFGAHSFSHDRFVSEVLAHEGVEDIAIAAEFEAI